MCNTGFTKGSGLLWEPWSLKAMYGFEGDCIRFIGQIMIRSMCVYLSLYNIYV